mmetsp:Transcript_49882/g.159530  ORF Transcript_49882/g.159530 Transcript_49882/m.159530 type:complete len:239 (-) Transcript_49882:555-1271(-)
MRSLGGIHRHAGLGRVELLLEVRGLALEGMQLVLQQSLVFLALLERLLDILVLILVVRSGLGVQGDLRGELLLGNQRPLMLLLERALHAVEGDPHLREVLLRIGPGPLHLLSEGRVDEPQIRRRPLVEVNLRVALGLGDVRWGRCRPPLLLLDGLDLLLHCGGGRHHEDGVVRARCLSGRMRDSRDAIFREQLRAAHGRRHSRSEPVGGGLAAGESSRMSEVPRGAHPSAGEIPREKI